MEDKKFKVIIVEDVKLELKGTEEIFRHEIPNAEVIGTAMTEQEFWTLIEAGVPDLVLLDLGLGGSTTIGVDICRNIFKRYPGVHVLIFTGEILNEKLWVDVLEAGADGIILKTGELLTKTDVQAVMDGKKLVFNYPILEKIVERFKKSVLNDAKRQEAIISYDIDEYDERFLRHLALGYTKEMIANLRGMPFGVKSLEKRQNDLIGRLFPPSERVGVNATRLVVRALELRILNIDNLEADDESTPNATSRYDVLPADAGSHPPFMDIRCLWPERAATADWRRNTGAEPAESGGHTLAAAPCHNQFYGIRSVRAGDCGYVRNRGGTAFGFHRCMYSQGGTTST